MTGSAYLDIAGQEGTVWFDDLCVSPGLTECCNTIEAQATIQPNPQYVYYSFALDPWTDTICIGNFTCGYTADDVDTSTLLINGAIHPAASVVNNEICLTFLLPPFISAYGELYDTTLHTYVVTGSFDDGVPFVIEGEVTLIGKNSQNPSQYIVPTDQVVLRADCNKSGLVNIADITYLVGFIFNSGERPVPHLVGDANCSLSVNVADVVYLVQYIFSGGAGPCPIL